ncbi:hypothetical protein C8R43DRAFT_1131945 [Mycena crocata]|nr:hypothetical protein C8R43DRAFT_1131945 [Mycena crocata]
MLQNVAPRLWKCGNDNIDAILTKYPMIHVPVYLDDAHEAQLPAFSHTEFCFGVDNLMPRQDLCNSELGRIITVLCHYDHKEGDVIFWRQETVTNFPPGSTFIMRLRCTSAAFALRFGLTLSATNANIATAMYASGFRQWLEESWDCPTCHARMHERPKLAPAVEAIITVDHPTWHDPSAGTYSWAGLKLPVLLEPLSD